VLSSERYPKKGTLPFTLKKGTLPFIFILYPSSLSACLVADSSDFFRPVFRSCARISPSHRAGPSWRCGAKSAGLVRCRAQPTTRPNCQCRSVPFANLVQAAAACQISDCSGRARLTIVSFPPCAPCAPAPDCARHSATPRENNHDQVLKKNSGPARCGLVAGAGD
jgi:hypothetical protein